MAADAGRTGEILSMYIFEAESMLRSFEGVLANAQKAGEYTRAQFNELFRVMHTLKGSSAMMGFNGIRDSAHAVEDMLSAFRDMKTEEIPAIGLSDVLYKAVGAYRQAVEELAKNGTVPEGFGELNAEVKNLLSDNRKAESAASGETADEAREEKKTGVAHNDASRFRVRLKPTQLPCVRAMVILKALSKKCEFVSSDPSDPGKHPEYASRIEKDGFIVCFKPKQGAGEDDVRAVILGQVDVESCEAEKAPPDAHAGAGKLVSVDQTKLSRQIEMLGELSSTQAMLEKLLENSGDENANRLLSQSRKYINYISETAIAMNMVTAESLFFRLRMLVRDISGKLGKNVELVLEGGDEPIERNMVDALYDPLMHMIRNCMDHGIEPPEERRQKGKDANGRIKVSIESRRYDVVISVSDDGRGIDPDAVLDKAVEKGLARSDRDYTRDDILAILLTPGFSTNSDVTEYSGRGVGLDVVNRSVRQMSGTLNVESEMGVGTTFTIKLPAALSMIEVLSVTAEGISYIIPTSSVKRLYGAEDVSQGHISKNGAGAWEFRADGAKTSNVINLADALSGRATKNIDGVGAFLTLSRQSGDIAVRADELGDISTVVIKPLPELIRLQPQAEAMYSGCTVMPDGGIALVVDVGKLN